MKNAEKNISKYIDHTLLRPSASDEEIEKLCAEADEYGFASVCVNPCHVKRAAELLKNSSVKVCTVIGFPLGASTSEVKAFETLKAYEDGCCEFDMVINIGALKSGRFDDVFSDIKAVVEAAKGRTVKVIIETFYLTAEEKELACKLSVEAGADFVKTCTGFNSGKATEADVALMSRAVRGTGVKVKASAGIYKADLAEKMIAAGASRIGTSAGVAVVKEYMQKA